MWVMKGAEETGWERLFLSQTPAWDGRCPCPALVSILCLGEKGWERRACGVSLTLLTALMAPGEQHKSWDPNYCLLTSLIKADLHFHEWLAAGRKENWAAGQGEKSGRGCQNSPCSCSGTLGVHLGLPRLVWSMSLGLSVMQHCGFFFPFSSPPCPAPGVLLHKKVSGIWSKVERKICLGIPA